VLPVAPGGGNPPDVSGQPGAEGLPVLQVSVGNPTTVDAGLNGLVIEPSGAGNDLTGIYSVQVYVDSDGDGEVDAGEVLLGSAAFSGDNMAATILFDYTLPPGPGVDLLVVYNFNPDAPDGTYQAGLIGILGEIGGGGTLAFSGLPLTGAIVTIAHPTKTHTSTPTVTDSPSFTPTFTLSVSPTQTHTPSETPTDTPSETATDTETSTPTPTDSMTPTHTLSVSPTISSTPNFELPTSHLDIPLIYPNPSKGAEQVKIVIPGLAGASDIKVKVLTVGFRKVREQTFPAVPPGGTVTLPLRDGRNTAFGNGLYYVLIETPQGRFVEKLIVLR
jgi:hypothetical protein